MKKWFVLIVWSIGVLHTLPVYCAADESSSTVKDYKPLAQYHSVYVPLLNSSNESVMEFLYRKFSHLQNSSCQLRVLHRQHTPAADYIALDVLYKNIPVYQSDIKVVIDPHHVIRAVIENPTDVSGWPETTNAICGNACWAVHNSKPVVCCITIEEDWQVLRHNNTEVYRHPLRSYSGTDSTVRAKVFLPDPLTTAGQTYGGMYIDNNNQDSPWLTDQLQQVNMRVRYEGGSFKLQSNFIRIEDFDLPSLQPVVTNSPQFFYTRSQSAFEDVNAYYHLSQMQSYIASLGFTMADTLVEVDVHAVNGADNSYYAPNFNPPRLFFGSGGVDDAEDADVLIHEYGHFISDKASPNSNFGSQRKAIDEAVGDYFAASYSKHLNTFNSERIFNWDGNNEFWQGRAAYSALKFPNDTSSSIYRNGTILCSALMNIYDALGRGVTDSLMLQMLYGLTPNMGLQQAARLLMLTDTLLFDGAHYCVLYQHLHNRGLLPAASNSCLLSVNEKLYKQTIKSITGPVFTLKLEPAEDMQLNIYDMQGKRVYHSKTIAAHYEYHNDALQKGVYFVQLFSDNMEAIVIKWIKTNTYE